MTDRSSIRSDSTEISQLFSDLDHIYGLNFMFGHVSASVTVLAALPRLYVITGNEFEALFTSLKREIHQKLYFHSEKLQKQLNTHLEPLTIL